MKTEPFTGWLAVEMRPGCVPTLLLLLLVPVLSLTHTGLQTTSPSGSTTADITVSYARDGVVVITCHLDGGDDAYVTQVNWVLKPRGSSNRTVLAAFHPDYGAHVAPELVGAEIQPNVADRSFALRLARSDAGKEEDRLCCVFNAFPLGVLERCKDMSTAAAQEAGTDVESQVRGVGQWTVTIVGFLICFLLIITMVIYLCKSCKHCCRTRTVFTVQTHLTDHHSNSEEVLEEPPQAPPLPATPPEAEGFSPAKLYAKIKLDRLYGRLWRSYQGTPRAWTPNPPPPGDPPQAHTRLQAPPLRVYSLLGELRPAPQEVETGSVPRDPQPDPQVTPAEERSKVNLNLVTPVADGSGETAAHPEDRPEEDCEGDVKPI